MYSAGMFAACALHRLLLFLRCATFSFVAPTNKITFKVRLLVLTLKERGIHIFVCFLRALLGFRRCATFPFVFSIDKIT